MARTGGSDSNPNADPVAVLLGTAQDGGYPQPGCKAECCNDFPGGDDELYPACLAVCDPQTRSRWIIDCTPAFPRQVALLDRVVPGDSPGFLLSHAHIGHYAGLINLGNEIMGARSTPVYTLPRMKGFLDDNLPWSDLAQRGNIQILPMDPLRPLQLGENIRITPRLVPHRDEHSETACFQIDGPNSSLLWLPDIDNWRELNPPIEELLAGVDRAYLDGCFFDGGELPGRDLSAIAHPTIEESIERFAHLDEETRNKISFIHLNHTNPAIHPESDAARAVQQAGHFIARQGDRIEL